MSVTGNFADILKISIMTEAFYTDVTWTQIDHLNNSDVYSNLYDLYTTDPPPKYGGGGSNINLKLIYTIVTIIGMCDNAMVILVIGLSKGLRQRVTNKYIMNQSIIDFLASLFLLITYRVPEYLYDSSWVSILVCKIWHSQVITWGLLISSTYNLIVMTLERHADLTNPLQHKASFTKTKTYASLAFPWLFGFAFEAFYSIPPANIQVPRCVYRWRDATLGYVAAFIALTVEWIIPLLVFLVVYIRILLMIRGKATSDIGEANETRGRIMQRGMRNTIKMMVSVAVAFVICWFPNGVIMLLNNIGYPVNFKSHYYEISSIMVLLNSVSNPVIYCLQYEQFRSAALFLLFRFLRIDSRRNPTNAQRQNN